MREQRARSDAAVAACVSGFRWDPFAIAVLRHSTLPWGEGFSRAPSAQIVPLDRFDGGERERLSLLGQLAAHVAFLRFAGINPGPFVAAEWEVVRRRGADVRLLRRAADAGAEPPDAFEVIQAAAEHLHVAGIDALQRSWSRPDPVFAAVIDHLARSAPEISWLRASGCGHVLAPGADALRQLWCERDGSYASSDAGIVDALRLARELDTRTVFVAIDSTSSLTPFEAIRLLGVDGSFRAAAQAAEALVPVLSSTHHVIAVPNEAALDAGSRQALKLAERMAPATWITVGGDVALPRTATFIVAPTIEAKTRFARRAAAETDARAWTAEFVASGSFDRFLADGSLPHARGVLASIAEPRRSYIGALALLGSRVPRDRAEAFLQHFFYDSPLEELAVDGVLAVGPEFVEFCDEGARASAATLIPAASLPALLRIAAKQLRGPDAARVLIDAGDYSDAIALLEGETLEPRVAIELLGRLPRESHSQESARMYAYALLAQGRYVDAQALVPQLAANSGAYVAAYADRRSGRYAEALRRLEPLDERDVDGDLLAAELMRLTGRAADAAQLLDGMQSDDIRRTYERELVRIDGQEAPSAALPAGYHAERLATYESLLRDDHSAAAEHAARALELASTTVERIDATIDRLFALFSEGRWAETRAAANEALELVDEAQGDRAAAWILYLLAFLAADDGQWQHSERQLRRLRNYHTARGDQRSLLELELVSAHLAFSRASFDEAAQRAHAVWRNEALVPQLREAAALILDEVDWILQRVRSLRSSGHSGNEELDSRHRFLADRLRDRADVTDALCAAATTRTDRLKALRCALGNGRREVAAELATGLGVELMSPTREADDVRVLRALAVHDFPFAPADLGVDWLFATRNRFGNWIQEGSVERPAKEIGSIADTDGSDWIRCGERELLFIAGSEAWSPAARDAAAAIVRMKAENQRLRRVLEAEAESSRMTAAAGDHGIVGESPAVRALFARIERVARRDIVVLVYGESGTGKELVARAVHRSSPRRQKPYLPINCAALPENLIESELFGHARGAFTSADRDRAGVIETADGGTLFLDEIGELPLAAQAKLLRFLQEGEFRRVGETVNRTADVRIVCATNRRLEDEVEKGRFREDLYYRLHGIEVTLPPLRERGRDILLLADHFLEGERRQNRGGPARLSDDVAALFMAHRWPGNVRELQQTIRGAHALAGDARELLVEHLPGKLAQVEERRTLTGSYQDAVIRFRRELIERSLLEARGNQNRAAALLQMSRQALAYQIRELGIIVRKQRGSASNDDA